MTAAAHAAMDQGTTGFSHDAARRLGQIVRATPRDTVVIDFGRVERVSTAAIAELVALRRKLLADGCDLRVTNLTGQVAAMHALCRLEAALPTT